MVFPVHSAAGGVLIAAVELVAIICATAGWVYTDAKAHAGRGRPIVSSVGSVQLTTPLEWFLACLLTWETSFPLYIDMRRG
jgi:hypothetical protein